MLLNLPMARTIRETTPEMQRGIIAHVVESVPARDGIVTPAGIVPRMEARPFFARMAVAPPDGPRGAGTAQVRPA